jgi:hypothetical protein
LAPAAELQLDGDRQRAGERAQDIAHARTHALTFIGLRQGCQVGKFTPKTENQTESEPNIGFRFGFGFWFQELRLSAQC